MILDPFLFLVAPLPVAPTTTAPEDLKWRTYLKKQFCKWKRFLMMRRETGSLTLSDLLSRMSELKKVG
ncbi:hypothetical protein L1987_33776 [Smallanthus sonchifolius]|uniref:Uncharacterized protein n=1 Tax=Smallanthus sonchifolius TaxID=185202 RepID=A0ACB9HS08_9ASTR|nr:hypothetical protein L1987_33776 [Smallanthus sonchifolius]